MKKISREFIKKKMDEYFKSGGRIRILSEEQPKKDYYNTSQMTLVEFLFPE